MKPLRFMAFVAAATAPLVIAMPGAANASDQHSLHQSWTTSTSLTPRRSPRSRSPFSQQSYRGWAVPT